MVILKKLEPLGSPWFRPEVECQIGAGTELRPSKGVAVNSDFPLTFLLWCGLVVIQQLARLCFGNMALTSSMIFTDAQKNTDEQLEPACDNLLGNERMALRVQGIFTVSHDSTKEGLKKSAKDGLGVDVDQSVVH